MVGIISITLFVKLILSKDFLKKNLLHLTFLPLLPYLYIVGHKNPYIKYGT